jgi:urease accessory protein
MPDPAVIANAVECGADLRGPADDRVVLAHDARLLRRRRLTAASGAQFVVDLPEPAVLEPGDALVLEDGRRITVEAAVEPLWEIAADAPGPDRARLALHLGYRGAPCEITADGALRVPRDAALARMLEGLGVRPGAIETPFCPERGATGESGIARADPAAHAHHHLTSADIPGTGAADGDGDI